MALATHSLQHDVQDQVVTRKDQQMYRQLGHTGYCLWFRKQHEGRDPSPGLLEALSEQQHSRLWSWTKRFLDDLTA